MADGSRVPAAASDGSSATSALLEDVASLSRRFGSDPEYTRGGGGNSSAKADGVLYIKASGQSLAALTAPELMPLRIEPLRELLEGGDSAPAAPGTDEIMRVALGARVNLDDDRRPSVECLFHALLPEPIVLHTHPTVVNALTCARDGRRLVAEILGDDVLWVPYVDPGLPLARLIAAERGAYETRTGRPAPRSMLLQNHGMIVTGDSADEVAAGCERIVEAIRARLEAVNPGPAASRTKARSAERVGAASGGMVPAITEVLRTLLAGRDRPKFILFDGSPPALEVASTTAGRELVDGGPLTPDQIVYAGSWPLWFDPIDLTESEDPAAVADAVRERLETHVAATGATPSVVVVAGLGLFVVADSDRFAATAREVIFDAMRVAQGAMILGGVRVLAPEERQFIEEWEAEAYRRGVESSMPATVRTT